MTTSLINRLDQRVTIERPITTSDGQGGQIISWSTLASVSAEVVQAGNYTSERSVADNVIAQAGYRVTIRRRDDVTAAMRIIWKNRTLLIITLHEKENVLEILAREVAV